MEIRTIYFYCKKCGKSTGMTYEITGEPDSLATTKLELKCPTNRCVRVLRLKKYTEAMLLDQADKNGKIYL